MSSTPSFPELSLWYGALSSRWQPLSVLPLSLLLVSVHGLYTYEDEELNGYVSSQHHHSGRTSLGLRDLPGQSSESERREAGEQGRKGPQSTVTSRSQGGHQREMEHLVGLS